MTRVAGWLSRTICQKAFLERAAIQTANAQLDDLFDNAASIVAKNIRSAMAVPLWNDDQVVGVLYADARVASYQQLSGDPAQNGRLLPEERELTVLFADIAGFTALSERMMPVEVANRLNRFFEEMLSVLFEKGGTLDKYIGDCIMAFFGAPQDQPDHAQRAVSTGLGMLDRLAELNRTGVFVPPVQIRIAINSGAAVVGDIGSDTRLEYTALGSTINLASRMEGICSPGDCVISEATYAQVSDRDAWSDFGEHLFRGIQRPVRIFCSGRTLEASTSLQPPAGSPPDSC